MVNNRSLNTAVDLANRFHAANFKHFAKKLNLDTAVRNGMAMYEIKRQLGAATVRQVPMSEVIKCPKS